jgi:hypothetical protein
MLRFRSSGQLTSAVPRAIAYLEQGGDGVSCDTPVGIGNQVLHVQIASSDSLGLGLGELVECLDSGEFEYSLWRGQE